MRESESFFYQDSCYVAVWIEEDGTEWSSDPKSECCEHAEDPKVVELYYENLFDNMRSHAPSPYDCSRPVEYVGGSALCRRHFEEVKFRSRVRWAQLEEYRVYERPH